MGERLREERMRLAFSQLAFSDACGVNRGTLATWEKGEQSPNAAVLAVMARAGVDLLYVVTGARSAESSSTLAPAERELLQAWRDGSAKGKAALQAVAALVKDD
ncbi:helix-turn-helix domain-containing protein [Comamonas antarctica]|nr:helix-turn-helix transcriptional regulator [Comamonas antarctica]